MDRFSRMTFNEYAVSHKSLDVKSLYELYVHRQFWNESIVSKYLIIVKLKRRSFLQQALNAERVSRIYLYYFFNLGDGVGG